MKTYPDLRRNVFQPGDRVSTNYTTAIGTVQPYPKDAATIEVVFDGEQLAVVFYVEELHLLRLVEPAPAAEADENAQAVAAALGRARDELLANSTPVGNPNVCRHGYRYENALCPAAECDAAPAVEPAAIVKPAPEEPTVPDYASSAYLAAVNLLYLIELLDRQHDVCLSIGWDGYRGRETDLHVGSDADFAAAEALATRIGLTEYTTREHKCDVHHRWTGERHGLRIRVVWIDRAAAGWHPEVQA